MDEIRINTARGTVPALTTGPRQAPPLVCLHGFPDHPLTFATAAQHLVERGWRVLAPFLRGYHADHVPDDGYADQATLVADAIALLDAIAPDDPAHVVGHDWGAMIVHGLAAARPDRLARGVAMAVPPLESLGLMLDDPVQLQRSFYMWFFQLADIPEMTLGKDRTFIDHLWAQWSPGLADVAHRAAVHEVFADPRRVSATLAYYRAMLDPTVGDPALSDLRGEIFGPSRIPLLVLAGTQDGCMGEDLFRAACANLPVGSDFAILDGVGHFLHLEEPAEVADRIDRWLRAG
jgi:pimeloyl-ACP methyl ester carboxylesterase